MILIDDLRRDVATLAAPGTRKIGTAGHDAARAYLQERLQALGLQPYGDELELPYEYEGMQHTNLVGEIPGADPSLAPLVLVAHYDTHGDQPGADDNAAAVAIVLSLIEELRESALARSILIALFDCEEQPRAGTPGMGSTWFYEHQRRGVLHGAVVLDLCGHDVPVPGMEDALFLIGAESDPALESVARDVAGLPDATVVASHQRYVGDLSDYLVFRLHQRPYLFFTCGRWPHYHRETDTPDRLNYEKMVRIRAAIGAATAGFARSELRGPFGTGDTTALEIELFQRHLGPLLDGLGGAPRTRADIDVLVARLLSLGL